jgi:hypothetical protein
LAINLLNQKKSVFSNLIRNLIKKELKDQQEIIKNAPMENSMKTLLDQKEEEVAVAEEVMIEVVDEEDQEYIIKIDLTRI